MKPIAFPLVRTKRVAVVQSNYIPWKGYFDLIGLVDEFILYDDVQFTRRDWRNRNRIKTRDGPAWLTIPVQAKGKYHQSIRETRIVDQGWNLRHWRTIAHNYRRAPAFAEYRGALEDLYRTAIQDTLTEINLHFLAALCGWLGISTPLRGSWEYGLEPGGRTERLVALCRRAGATEYLSGPSARGYLEQDAFDRAGIALRFMDYSGYAEYPQIHPPFEHAVSVIDLILHRGRDARSFLKSPEASHALRSA